jgi:copper binding protein CusF
MVARRLAPILILAVWACGGRSEPPVKENTYPMTATIVSRDPAQNTVNLDNKEVPGVMEAMKMDYELRGAKVNELPPDGTPVTARLHERDGRYWVTDVRRLEPRP